MIESRTRIAGSSSTVKMCVVKNSTRCLLTLTAVLLTLGFTGVEGGTVLCFGGDGHVAIETVGPRGCAEVGEAEGHSASTVTTAAASSHCGPCVDVILTASSITEATSAWKRTGAAPAVLSMAVSKPSVSYRGRCASSARSADDGLYDCAGPDAAAALDRGGKRGAETSGDCRRGRTARINRHYASLLARLL